MDKVVLDKVHKPTPTRIVSYEDLTDLVGNLTIENPETITVMWQEIEDSTACVVYVHNATDEEIRKIKGELRMKTMSFFRFDVYNKWESITQLMDEKPSDFI